MTMASTRTAMTTPSSTISASVYSGSLDQLGEELVGCDWLVVSDTAEVFSITCKHRTQQDTGNVFKVAVGKR